MARGVVKRLFSAENIRDLDASQPFGHVCRPKEVAAAVVYLASDANRYVSGQNATSMAAGNLPWLNF